LAKAYCQLSNIPLEEEGLAQEPHSNASVSSQQHKPGVFAKDDTRFCVQGLVAVADVVRADVPAALERARQLGIRRLVLMTGDNARVAGALARQLGVEFRTEMLPEDKIEFVRNLQGQGCRVAMIGDGINDAPALAQADAGIAMGVAGTHVAMEAASIALMTDNWAAIPGAISLARRAFLTIQQNIAFGLLFNLACLTLAATGILAPVMAAAAQSLPDVAVFLNSSRLLRARITTEK
jgi:Cd2+/Zn2+-exporting ATPase/Cu+-exporting ATPase